MAKRYRRYKRRPRKVRRFRRKRMMRRSNKYDGAVSIKCHVVSDVKYETTYGHGDVSINWGGTDTATNDYVRITQSQEYQSFATLFSQYRIMGVKMRWQPITTVTSAATSYYIDGWYCGKIGQLPSEITGDNEILGSCDYKLFNPSRPYSKYIKVSKYFAKRDEKWLPVGQSYSSAGSLFRIYAAGYNDETLMGKMHVTYYVRLKGHLV